MPVSALVVTLSADPGLAGLAMHSLQAESRYVLGRPVPSHGRELPTYWLPVVIESDSIVEAHGLAESLEQLAGVLQVELVSVDASDLS